MTDLNFVHRFVPATAPGAPVLLLLHGTGGNEQDLVPLGQALLPGAALLSPLENGMPRFFRRLAEGVFDTEDLKRRTHELADFIDSARWAYTLTGETIAIGYSNGANIASILMLLRPGTLRGAVLFRPSVPFVPDKLPKLNGTEVLLAAGRRHQIVPVSEAAQLRRMLEHAGAAVLLHWHNGGHGAS